jgi:hypothetical protein
VNYLGLKPPTYANQLKSARELLARDGPNALWSPHAATGRICGCGACFCCAALEVWKEHRDQFLSHEEHTRRV